MGLFTKLLKPSTPVSGGAEARRTSVSERKTAPTAGARHSTGADIVRLRRAPTKLDAGPARDEAVAMAGTPSAEPAAAQRVVSRNSAPPLYRQLSDLPPHVAVVSGVGSDFALGSKQQESLFVLRLTEGDQLFAVIATKEMYGSALFKGTVARIEAAGGTVKHSGVTDGALITRMYRETAAQNEVAEGDIKPIIRDIDALVQAALDLDSSDIHIEKRASRGLVRLRVRGDLERYSDSWDGEYVMRMARALHAIADEDSKDTTFTVNGQMGVSRTLPSGARVKLRVQVSPAYPDDSIDIVIRVLRVAAEAKVKSLEDLGYAPEHVAGFEYMLSEPNGLIAVVGTTGSGKSTTQQTCMAYIYERNPGSKLLSIEDPPEYVMHGVTQIPVARRRNETENPFIPMMKAAMRMDPDGVMVGEVRDSASANALVGMVQSGHKVLTTMHTSSALGAVPRLREMGVEASVIGDRGFISGLIYQTLVPELCDHCKRDYDPTSLEGGLTAAMHERIRHVIKPGDMLFVRADSRPNSPDNPNKCRHCGGRGIKGRTVCAEMVIPDDTIRKCIRDDNMNQAYEHWRGLRAGKSADSMLGATALEHGILKMRRGDVSPVDVEKSLGLLFDFAKADVIAGETGDLLGLSS